MVLGPASGSSCLGLDWRDRRREDGAFVDEPAPASSLYHIICAVAALKEAA
jgi:mannose-6-phosphate isomerase